MVAPAEYNPLEDEFMTPEEVANLLRVTPLTLYNFRKKGEGPSFVKVGGAIRYPKTLLNKYLKDNLK